MANPNPSPETRFGAENGNARNVGGRTSEQRKRDYETAEMASQVRHHALTVMLEKISEIKDPHLMKELLDATGLKLIKDSEDRAHGTPANSIQLSGDEENPVRTVNKVTFVGVKANVADD